MKALILALLMTGWTGVLPADPPGKPQTEPKPDQNLEEAKMQTPIKMEKAVPMEDKWLEGKSGVLGQFIQAPNLLAPINPFAKPMAGFGQSNLSKDTVTGRIMGLRLIKFEF